MRVLAYARQGEGFAVDLAQAFVAGARRHGAQAEVRWADRFAGPEPCDAIWLYGLIGMRRIFDAYRWKALRITGDLGYWRERASELPLDRRPVRIAIEAQQPNGHLRLRTHAPDRFLALGLGVEPVRERGEHILVCGQHAEQAEFQGFEYGEWEAAVVRALLAISARPLMVREKPGSPPLDLRHAARCVNLDIGAAVRAAWAVVCCTGNVGADCLLHGVPVFAESGPGRVYYRSRLEEIDAAMPLDAYRRIAALADLAYWQWTTEEFAAGMLWEHLAAEAII